MKILSVSKQVYSEPYYFVRDENKDYYITVGDTHIEYVECETLKTFKRKKIDKGMSLQDFLLKSFEEVDHISETPVMFLELDYGDGNKETVAIFPCQSSDVEYWNYRTGYALIGQHCDISLSIPSEKSKDIKTINRLKGILESEPYNYKLKEVSRTPKYAIDAIRLAHNWRSAKEYV